jgi:hypothetical protein
MSQIAKCLRGSFCNYYSEAEERGPMGRLLHISLELLIFPFQCTLHSPPIVCRSVQMNAANNDKHFRLVYIGQREMENTTIYRKEEALS